MHSHQSHDVDIPLFPTLGIFSFLNYNNSINKANTLNGRVTYTSLLKSIQLNVIIVNYVMGELFSQRIDSKIELTCCS